ncbi:uncharacterized protein LOC130590528 [Beta vulgaris subsp. vulgaris]|uniref:uncharacterized protein LOC130590528 n=1 Tax=Beta vulgaris subsp. vulgaris TaxID=3555 RepID=UPI002547F62E|nr:uncharacterized protein LOC130590528 [Beta vulgaris subsp. vulgaris]
MAPFEALDDSGTVEQVKLIQQKMKAAQDRQKSYGDKHRRHEDFRLALPPGVDRAHNVFHVSQLRRYISDPSHVLQPESLQLDDNMTYEEFPVQILDHKIRKTRKGETKIVKVLWSNHNSEESTWEAEDAMRLKYPHLFTQGFDSHLWHAGVLQRCNAVEAGNLQVRSWQLTVVV